MRQTQLRLLVAITSISRRPRFPLGGIEDQDAPDAHVDIIEGKPRFSTASVIELIPRWMELHIGIIIRRP
jgi:hypothetical protein